MDCRLCRKHIKEYIQNKLDGKHMLAFAYHLTQCPDCRREVAQIINMNKLFDSWETPELSSSFHRNLNARLEKERRPKWWVHVLNPLPMRVVSIGAVATIALVASFVFMQPELKMADQDIVDLAIIEDVEVLKKLEMFQNIELFENWEIIEQLDALTEEHS